MMIKPAALIVIGMLISGLHGQRTGEWFLYGRITDLTGCPISDVRVTVTSTDGNLITETVTDLTRAFSKPGQ